MRLTRRLFVCAISAVALVGCLSPTLPMPPPAPPDVQAVGQGRYELSGTLAKEALVLSINRRTEEVNGEVAKPTYRFVVNAQPGDNMTLWYVDGLKSSEGADFTIPGPIPDGGVPADAAGD